MAQLAAFALGVLLDIYGYYPYTENSTSLCHSQDKQFRIFSPGWAGIFNIRLTNPPTNSLRPINPDNARALRITAAAGT